MSRPSRLGNRSGGSSSEPGPWMAWAALSSASTTRGCRPDRHASRAAGALAERAQGGAATVEDPERLEVDGGDAADPLFGIGDERIGAALHEGHVGLVPEEALQVVDRAGGLLELDAKSDALEPGRVG